MLERAHGFAGYGSGNTETRAEISERKSITGCQRAADDVRAQSVEHGTEEGSGGVSHSIETWGHENRT